MKKFLLLAVTYFVVSHVCAQDTTTIITPNIITPDSDMIVEKPQPKKRQYNLTNRPNDHFMVQLGYTGWAQVPDSIKTKGFSRSVNVYFMFDFPFKSTQQLSAAVGLGIGSDHIFFDKSFPDVKGTTANLRFNRSSDTSLYKKTKLVTSYLELPIELRYVTNPEKSDKSFKVAVGAKVGTMLKAGTRSRAEEGYLLKESSKNYFNTTRVVGTARIGYGHFSLFGTYQFTGLLKDGAGPVLRPFTIGLALSGL